MSRLLHDRFKIHTVHEMAQTLLVFTPTEPLKQLYSYQVEMLHSNPSPCVAPLDVKRKNGDISFRYNITSRISLKSHLSSCRNREYTVLQALSVITSSLLSCSSLLLYERCFILDDEFIFIEPESGALSLLYLPAEAGSDLPSIRDFIPVLCSSIPGLHEGGALEKVKQYTGSPGFSLGRLNTLLHQLTSGMPLNEAPPGDPVSRECIEQDAPDRAEGIPSEESRLPKRGLILKAILMQAFIVLMALLCDRLLVMLELEDQQRYIAAGLLILVCDLLSFKYLLTKPFIRITARQGVKSEDTSGPQEARSTDSTECDAESETTAQVAIPEFTCEINSAETMLLSPCKPGAFLVVEREDTSEKFDIPRDRCIIGRNRHTSHIVLTDRAVGRVHAQIEFRDGEYYIMDKDSKNGTYLNDEKLAKGVEYRLSHESGLIFANVPCRFMMY